MPKRRTFYSFHFKNDAWRAGQVRNIGATEHDEPVSDNDWEAIKKGGDSAIEKWIDDQMKSRSCVIVLVGSQTANRKWINYEIRKAWTDKKGLLAIRIHRLLDQDGKSSTRGDNPFSYIKLKNGKTIADYPQHAKLYNPPGANSKDVYGRISDHIAEWVENAIENHRQ